MTILSTVYASAPAAEVIIPTLEIRTPTPIYTCAGFEDQEVTLEDGTDVTFTASGLDVSLPARNDTGQQTLTFAIENVTGIAQREIELAIENGSRIPVIYRPYLSSDLSAPAEAPIKLNLSGADFRGSTVQVTCSYQDPINTAWPRLRYTADFAPGLVYFR